MKNEIYSIKENGFTNVKWYDAGLNYTYYDALLNGVKVEVRTSEDKIEWRYLGVEIEDIEWYALKPILQEEKEVAVLEDEVEAPVLETVQIDKKEDLDLVNKKVNIGKNHIKEPIQVNILVNLNNSEKEEQLTLSV